MKQFYREIVIFLLTTLLICSIAIVVNTCSISNNTEENIISTSTTDDITTKTPDETTTPTETTVDIKETTRTPEITKTPGETTKTPAETTRAPETTYDTVVVLPSPDYIHIIKAGDTFWDISRKYYGSAQYCNAIAKYNGLELTSVVHQGFELRIPDLSNEKFQQIYQEIINTTPDTDYMAGETIKAGTNGTYKYGTRGNPAVDIKVPTGTDMKNYTGEVDTSNYIYVGNWSMVTGYTPTCEHCCHSSEGITASGVRAICGYTIATPIQYNIPFQTTLYFPGYGYYVNEDRVDTINKVADIAAPNHEACGPLTAYNINGYIVPNPGDTIITEYGYKKLIAPDGTIKLIVDPNGNVQQ